MVHLVWAALAGSIIVQAADVQFYVVQKRVSYSQSDSGLPVLNASSPYRFEADVIATGAGLITSATLKIPSGAIETISVQSGSTEAQFKQNFATTALLDAAFGAGPYVYTISTVHDGAKVLTLNLPADNFPGGPHVSNFSAAQSINAASNFTLSWDPFPGGTANDFITVEIDDAATGQTIFETPPPGNRATLNGTATSVVIPANTLSASHSYAAKLEFARVTSFDTSSYSGAEGVVLFSARNGFNLNTAGAGASGPDITQFHVAKGQQLTQTSSAAPALKGSTAYLFDASAGLNFPNAATGTIRLPNGTTKVLSAGTEDLNLHESYASQASLDASDPDGQYTITLSTVHNGVKTIALNLAGSNYPTTPQISNYDAAQKINPSASFTLSWNAFAGGTAADFISLEVEGPTGETLFSTGDFGASTSLNGTATFAVIPAGVLQPGQSYNARLLFIKLTASDSTSYPGVTGVAGYFKQTDFAIATAGGSFSGPDVKQAHLAKGWNFSQTGSGAAVLQSNNPFVFNSGVTLAASNSVRSATLTLPNGAAKSFTLDSDELKLEESFPTQAALDLADPNGTFVLTLNTVHDGTKTLRFNLNGDLYPPAPHIKDLSLFQSVNSSAAFTLSWDAFAGGRTNDFISMSLESSTDNSGFDSADIGKPGSLNGTSTSVLIPANALQPGQTYRGRLLFVRVTGTDTNSYPGVLLVTGYLSQTEFSLTTAGGSPLKLSQPALMANGAFQLRINGTPNRSYNVQASTDLFHWTTLGSAMTDGSGAGTYTDSQAATLRNRYYRVVAGMVFR